MAENSKSNGAGKIKKRQARTGGVRGDEKTPASDKVLMGASAIFLAAHPNKGVPLLNDEDWVRARAILGVTDAESVTIEESARALLVAVLMLGNRIDQEENKNDYC